MIETKASKYMYAHCTYTLQPHSHTCRTQINHVATQRDSKLSVLASRRSWDLNIIELQRWTVYDREPWALKYMYAHCLPYIQITPSLHISHVASQRDIHVNLSVLSSRWSWESNMEFQRQTDSWNSILILILSFVFILIVLHSSLANWWHGWCVPHVGEWAFNVRMVNKQLVNRDTNKCRNFLAQPIVLSDLRTKYAIPFFPIRHFAG